jgi:hypothetical protein
MYKVGPGATTRDALRHSGWAFADSTDNLETWILASPESGVETAEAVVAARPDGSRDVRFVRLRFARTRLATYKEMVHKLVKAYGPPQQSGEVSHFQLFEMDQGSDAPRPRSFIVDRWKGDSVALVLVGGLEAAENLAESMQYQLFLLPSDAVISGD